MSPREEEKKKKDKDPWYDDQEKDEDWDAIDHVEDGYEDPVPPIGEDFPEEEGEEDDDGE